MFRKDSKIITPEALATVKSAIADSGNDKKVELTKNSFKKKVRKKAGSWVKLGGPNLDG